MYSEQLQKYLKNNISFFFWRNKLHRIFSEKLYNDVL